MSAITPPKTATFANVEVKVDPNSNKTLTWFWETECGAATPLGKVSQKLDISSGHFFAQSSQTASRLVPREGFETTLAQSVRESLNGKRTDQLPSVKFTLKLRPGIKNVELNTTVLSFGKTTVHTSTQTLDFSKNETDARTPSPKPEYSERDDWVHVTPPEATTGSSDRAFLNLRSDEEGAAAVSPPAEPINVLITRPDELA